MRFTRTAALTAIAAFVLPAAAAAQTGPAWAATHLPADVLALSCAPTATFEMPEVPLRITGGQSLEKRYSAAPGDLITVNAGRANGMQYFMLGKLKLAGDLNLAMKLTQFFKMSGQSA